MPIRSIRTLEGLSDRTTQIYGLDRATKRCRREGSLALVMLHGERGAEQRHEAVTQELADGAIAVNRVERQREEAVQQLVHPGGRQRRD